MPAAMVEDLPGGQVREALDAAVDEIEVQDDEHLRWAQHAVRMISLQATSGPPTSLSMKVEEVIARIKNLLT